jgi:hypothetical protein
LLNSTAGDTRNTIPIRNKVAACGKMTEANTVKAIEEMTVAIIAV